MLYVYFHAQTHTQEYRCPKRPEASELLEPRLQVVLSFPSVGARNCILQFSAGAASPPNPQAISLASKLRYLKERLVVSPFDYLTIKTMVSKKLDFPRILRRVPQEKPGSAWCQPEEVCLPEAIPQRSQLLRPPCRIKRLERRQGEDHTLPRTA